jgi:hypothetical protein
MKPNSNESKQDFLRRCTNKAISEGKGAEEAYSKCSRFWDEAKGTYSALTLAAPFQLLKKSGGQTRAFMITAYTGAVIDLGWSGKFVFDVTGMKSKEKFPVLREHKRDRVVGIGTRSWNDGRNFFMRGDFASTRDGREVLDLAEQGFPWQASVGIWPKKIKRLENDKESAKVNGMEIKGPAEIWLKSMVGEVSFVAIGADDQSAAVVLHKTNTGVHQMIEHEKSADATMILAARKLVDEEGISFAAALKRIWKERPELHKKWLDEINEACLRDA